MSYIIKSPDELKEPFLCYCVFQRFMEEAGEDYIDYNERIVNGTPLLFWMLGKGYISGKETEEVLERTNGKYIYVQSILQDDSIFKESYGGTAIGAAKSYSILAEYMCQISEFRQRLYDSVNNKSTGFMDYKFYKDKNGISLACIISDENMMENKLYSLEELKEMTVYEFDDLSYKDQFNAVRNLTIKEADCIEEKYN
nr:hypothetical protein [uncultured Lachnoclostridium sp.]